MWDDLTGGNAMVVVCNVVLVVSTVGGTRTVVAAAHTRGRRGIHASLNHGGRTRSKRTAIIRDHLRLVVKHPRLAPKDVRIEGVVGLPLLQAALHNQLGRGILERVLDAYDEVHDSEDNSSDTQDTGSNSADNGTSRNGGT